MKHYPRCLLVLGPALLVLLAGGACGRDASSPPELAQQVEIRRTAYGVPHILGENEAAVAFGLGYAQAEDHLLGILRLILAARGELAQHFGGEENLRSDLWNRQFRVHVRAVETYPRLDADFRSILEGFAAGLNYYIELHRQELPDWVQPVEGRDIAAHGMTGVMRFAFNRGGVVQRFLRQQMPADEAREQAATGSNMWALAPERTTSGHAILMGNPHQPWTRQAATYYEAHLTVPGKINFYGSTFIGRPVLTTGFNQFLSWSHTVNYPDLEEIYELELDPDVEDHYRFDGQSLPLERDQVAVVVKEEDGPRIESREFWYSELGPVIHRDPTRVWVLKSAVYDEFRFYQQWYRLAQAKNFDEFKETLRTQAIPMFNIAYADRDGNIFYLWNGTVPELPHPAHAFEAVPASGSNQVWSAVHPLDELPQLLNPAGGYVQNSNDPPYFTNLSEPMRIDDFPAYFPRHRLGLRTQHGLEILHNDRKLSLEDSRDAKFSLRMLLADRVKDDLLSALRSAQFGEAIGAVVDLLESWDNTASADSRGSVLFKLWWLRYGYGADGPTLPSGSRLQPDTWAQEWSPQQPTTTPHGLGAPERAVDALQWAVSETEKRFGAWDVAWGEVHRLRQPGVDLAVGGCSGLLGCFRVLAFAEATDGKLELRHGDSWIFTVEHGDTPRAYTVVGYSQSSVEGSPHFSDQAELFAANSMKRAAFTEEEIAAQLLASYRPGEEG